MEQGGGRGNNGGGGQATGQVRVMRRGLRSKSGRGEEGVAAMTVAAVAAMTVAEILSCKRQASGGKLCKKSDSKAANNVTRGSGDDNNNQLDWAENFAMKAGSG